jgi:hypothetical protein
MCQTSMFENMFIYFIIDSVGCCGVCTFFLICLGVSVTNIAVFSALDDILPLGPCSPGKNLLCINDGLWYLIIIV